VAHGVKINVYGFFSAMGVHGLHLFKENLTGAGYVEILEKVLLPAVDAIDGDYIYLADRAPVHTAKVAQAWLEKNVCSHITPEEWPAHSPDLNPIENAWALMKDRVAFAEPKNLEQLEKAVLAAWNEVMTPEYCLTLAESMDRRLTDVRLRQGGHTRY
jgi:hypothetical protein